MATASVLDCWLYWLLHAHEYEPEKLLSLFPDAAIQQATRTIIKIAEVTEDKAMYDSREKAIRDQQWMLNVSRNEGRNEGRIEGRDEGEIKMIRMLQEILQLPLSPESDFNGKFLEELQQQTTDLQTQIRNRHS